MKKLAALAGAGALLLGMALPVLAYCCGGSDDDATIWNRARVSNRVYTKADSGDNFILGGWMSRAKIKTGAAAASASVLNDVNYTQLGCDCLDGDLEVHNRAKIRNSVKTIADSGDNVIWGGMMGCSRIRTGDATAGSAVTNFVNTVIVDGVDGIQ